MSILFTILIFLVLISIILADSETKVSNNKKKSTKDWSKVNFDDLDKEWEDGDDEEDLETESARMEKLMNKHNRRGPPGMHNKGINMKDFDPKNPQLMKKMLDQMNSKKNMGMADPGKATMIFVEIVKPMPNGEAWDEKSLKLLTSKWNALVKTASLSADFFNIPDGTILVNVQKPWMYQGLMDFVARQPETVMMTVDQKEYYPKDILGEDEL